MQCKGALARPETGNRVIRRILSVMNQWPKLLAPRYRGYVDQYDLSGLGLVGRLSLGRQSRLLHARMRLTAIDTALVVWIGLQKMSSLG